MAVVDYISKWEKCLEFIKDNIGETRYKTWFSDAKAIAFEDNKLTISLPSKFFFEKYEDDFYNLLTAALRKNFGEGVKRNYIIPVIKGDPASNINLESSAQSHIIKNKIELQAQQHAAQTHGKEGPKDFDPQLNPALNFENYCVGDSNKLALTIAEYIANNPKNNNFNPFFLYGDVGIGKTHLIQAIGIRVKERFPQAKVLFTTLKQFQTLYANAVITKKVPNFINWYMQMDVLLFDDLQSIAHKAKTADDALFPIFNHLHQNGRQLVFTCDRPPMELDGVADRLIDRFKWGITEKLNRPDYNLRKKILTFKAKHNGLDLSEEVIDVVAQAATSSVRELEGIVMGILTRSITLNAPITVELAKDVMKNFIKTPVKKILNFDIIVEATAEQYNLNPDVIFSKSRVRDIADARQVIMYLCNKHTGLSSVSIGAKLNRGHATVLHGISSVKERLSVSDSFKNMVAEIEASLD